MVSMASLPAYVKMKRVLGLEEVQLDQLGHLTGACLVCLEPPDAALARGEGEVQRRGALVWHGVINS